MSIICIGDIHGCASTFDNLLSNEISLKKSDKIVFLGDYIDRGPDSKGVVDIIIDLISRGYDISCLLGNHEDMFIESEEDDEMFIHWYKNCGGYETLKSFNVKSFSELSEQYKYFFKTLLHFKIIEKKIISVHAGLNFNNKDIFDDKYAMLWSRNNIIDHNKLSDKIIIHGHTPQPFLQTQWQLENIATNKIINIDNGCVFSRHQNLGKLTALDITNKKLFTSSNIDTN
jgi:serine/threonine protein phosphatase 1